MHTNTPYPVIKHPIMYHPYHPLFYQNCSSPSQLTMDATPSYVWLDYVPELVQRSYTKKELAKKKFLLLLREPGQDNNPG